MSLVMFPSNKQTKNSVWGKYCLCDEPVYSLLLKNHPFISFKFTRSKWWSACPLWFVGFLDFSPHKILRFSPIFRSKESLLLTQTVDWISFGVNVNSEKESFLSKMGFGCISCYIKVSLSQPISVCIYNIALHFRSNYDPRFRYRYRNYFKNAFY